MSARAIVVVDGEHYPPVTIQAIGALRARGYDVVAAVFAGGGEKLREPLDLGDIPIVRAGDAGQGLDDALVAHMPDVVYDLSDDPVVDHSRRMALAAIALARGAAYEAPGFSMRPPPRMARAPRPSIAIIGTGKRCGKTAVSAHVARTLARAGADPAIVAMGRGGPAMPVVIRPSERPDVARLLALADAGEHAASDVYEDAVLSGVPVAGARRAAAGPAGETAFDTVAAAVETLVDAVDPDLLILEGSGTAIPPYAADATILVARDEDDPGAWPAAHRILLADLVVVRMPSEEVTRTRLVPNLSALTSPNRDQAPIVPVAFRPTPAQPVTGRKIFVATTAPDAAGDAIRAHLEDVHGARVVGISHRLSDRARLAEELSAAVGKYEVLACELKAAAVDTAVRIAAEVGAETVFLDNSPIALQGDLESEIRTVAQKARTRFGTR